MMTIAEEKKREDSQRQNDKNGKFNEECNKMTPMTHDDTTTPMPKMPPMTTKNNNRNKKKRKKKETQEKMLEGGNQQINKIQ